MRDSKRGRTARFRARFVVPYALLVSLVAAWCAGHPEWNFDLLGYTAAVLSWRSESILSLHRRVYETLARVAPPFVNEQLILTLDYRKAVFVDAEAFFRQVRLYTNKPLYVALVGIASTDDGVMWATSLISAISYAALAVLVLVWTSRIAPPLWAAVVSCLFMLSSPLVEAARLSTPDMLAALLLSLGTFFVLESRRLAPGNVFLCLGCAARPDVFIAASLVLGYSVVREGPGWRAVVRPAAVGAVAALLVSRMAFALGLPWRTLMEHTFSRRLYKPADMSAVIGAGAYVGAVVRGLVLPRFSNYGALLVHALLTFGVLVLRKTASVSKEWPALASIAWASIGLHYLGFPMLSDRFFLSSYLLVVVAALGAVNEWWAARASEVRPAASWPPSAG
ncbi:MAG TPA: hypothetical protein VHU80_20395 [Polyangiaceae bacterium]|nr:hypothetical protein [Polyangiaceae bacterium]